MYPVFAANTRMSQPSNHAGACWPKTEVGSTLDETPGVQLGALVREQRVLEPREGTSVVAAVGICTQGDGLATRAVVILHVHVVQLEVGLL